MQLAVVQRVIATEAQQVPGVLREAGAGGAALGDAALQHLKERLKERCDKEEEEDIIFRR